MQDFVHQPYESQVDCEPSGLKLWIWTLAACRDRLGQEYLQVLRLVSPHSGQADRHELMQ